MKNQAHLKAFVGVLLYLGVVLTLAQLNKEFSALQIVMVCGAYILLNTLYSAHKRQLTFKRFFEYSLLALLVAVLGMGFLT